MSNAIQKRWLTTDEFEKEFNVGLSGQETWRKKRILPFTKIGSRIYYDRQLIDKVFEEHCVVEGAYAK